MTTVGNSSVSTPAYSLPSPSCLPPSPGPPILATAELFPRYGDYCGPNWSSGKAGHSPVWDQRPIDWLDFCCYCHDIGNDTHDQAKLLEADIEFLQCLETQKYVVKGDAHVARLYKTMCVTGLKNLLIPYRKNLVKLRSSEQPVVDFGRASNLRWKY